MQSIERKKTKTLQSITEESGIGLDALDFVIASNYGRDTIVHRNSLNAWGTVVMPYNSFLPAKKSLGERSPDVAAILETSVSFLSNGDVHLRTQNCYRPGQQETELVVSQFLPVLQQLEHTQHQEPFSKEESTIVLGLLDQLRSISQSALYLCQQNALHHEEPDYTVLEIEHLAEQIAEMYYHCYFDGHIKGAARLAALPAILHRLNLNGQGPREFDDPGSTVTLALQILNRLSKENTGYDCIIDFPQGSMGLGRELNAISTVLRGAPLAPHVVDAHYSSYRRGAFLGTIPPYQRKRFCAPKQRLLLADDNLVSGATLLYARQDAQQFHPAVHIDCCTAQLYEEGIEQWQKGNVQHIAYSAIEQLVSENGGTADTVQKLMGTVFRHGIFGKTGDLIPLLPDGSRLEEQYLEWNAMLTPDAITTLDIPQTVKKRLLEIYGFQDYSAIYDGTFDILSYYPVSPLRIDYLDDYIRQLRDISGRT